MDLLTLGSILIYVFTVHAVSEQYGSSKNSSHRELPQQVRNEHVKGLWKLTGSRWFNPVLQNQSILDELLLKNRLNLHTAKSVYFSPGFELNEPDNLHRKKRSDSSVDCEGICSTSLCPWNEEWDEEISRVPRFIKYAECASRDCDFNIDGVGRHVKSRLRHKTYCDTVRTDIQVLEDGEEKWLTHWPIACICARRRTVTHAQPSNTDYYLSAITAQRMAIPARQASFVAERHDPVSDSPDSSDNGPGLRLSGFTRNQRRQLRQQQRRISQNSETFDQLMRRKTRTSVIP